MSEIVQPNKRRIGLIISASSAILLLALGLFFKPPHIASGVWIIEGHRPISLPVGVEAPHFALPTVEGNIVRMADFKGQHVALIFVRSNCPYCHELEEHLEKYPIKDDRQLFIISLDQIGETRTIQAAHPFAFPILVDSTGILGKEYEVSAVPTVYLIDEEGKIEASASGMPNSWDLIKEW